MNEITVTIQQGEDGGGLVEREHTVVNEMARSVPGFRRRTCMNAEDLARTADAFVREALVLCLERKTEDMLEKEHQESEKPARNADLQTEEETENRDAFRGVRRR